ncbi:fucose 4-O-acetylase-like acetyltransferase [Ruminococcaceae bacterium R-25]|nr:fucose 4-O-acetylase-like acetyltransferase [Ruminococcaceae bacterium R-25]SUQ11262.1 Fucose 4-O-acetylase [Oscillospiraceae bacterium]
MEKAIGYRDYKIDWIRALCTLTVIVAHVGSPDVLNQIRTFDVVALVMISGMSMSFSSVNYLPYLWKRIRKLLIPSYIVITLIFALSFVACKLLHTAQLYPVDRMLRSYLLFREGSMGYVWIVRIFLYIAVLEPVIRMLAEKIKSIVLFFGVIVMLALAGFLLYRIYLCFTEPLLASIFDDFLFSPFVYCVIALTGNWFIKNKEKWLYILIGAVIVFAISQIIVSGYGFIPDDYKYPPQIYYCAYGVSVTLILYKLLPDIEIKAVSWLSKNSFMIYLLHILVLRVCGLAAKISCLKFLEDIWFIEYIVVVAGAVVLTLIVNAVKQKFTRRKRP